MINVKYPELKKIKRDEKLWKNISTYYISYETTSTVKSFYLIINEINGYIKESNGNKYLSLIPTKDSKEMLKKYEKLWKKSEILLDQ